VLGKYPINWVTPPSPLSFHVSLGTVSSFCPGHPQTMILLPPTPDSWDYRCMGPHLVVSYFILWAPSIIVITICCYHCCVGSSQGVPASQLCVRPMGLSFLEPFPFGVLTVALFAPPADRASSDFYICSLVYEYLPEVTQVLWILIQQCMIPFLLFIYIY
jgi:hypothetical protein